VKILFTSGLSSGQYLVKLWARVQRLAFLTQDVFLVSRLTEKIGVLASKG